MKEKIINYISSDKYSKKTVEEISTFLNIQALEFKDYIKAINELEEEGLIYITNKGFVHYGPKVNIYVGKIKSIKKYYLIRNTYQCKRVFCILKDMTIAFIGIEKIQLLRFGYQLGIVDFI